LSVIKQILIALYLSACTITSAQEVQDKIPKKAGIYSTILPGSGQFYTKKYWKIPIIYAGLVTSAYFIHDNNTQYKKYQNAAIKSSETGENQLGFTYSQLIILTNHHKRNKDISIICFVGTYILNIIDASVSAHLFDYDVSDDLSLHIQPFHFSKQNATGISLCFNL
jgi:hypothetical protein